MTARSLPVRSARLRALVDAGMLGIRPRLLSVADFTLFALGNFLLGITLSRHYSNEAFAGFGVGVSIALMVQSMQRGLYLTPAILMSRRSAQRYLPGIAGEHLLLLALTLLPCLLWIAVAGLAHMPAVSIAAAIGTLASSATYLQSDFDRMMQAKRAMELGSALLAAGYLATVALIWCLAHYAGLPFWGAMAILVAFALAKMTVVMALHCHPNLRWGRRFLRQDLRERGRYTLIGTLSYAGYNHLPVLILASLAPPRQVAAFVAMRTLAQPLQTILRALDIADKNAMRDRAQGSIAGLRRIFWHTVRTYLLVAALVLAAVALFGDRLVHLAYGTRYEGLESLALWHCTMALLMSLTLPIESVVNVVRQYRNQTGWRIASAVAGTLLALLLCGRIGAYGAAIAIVSGWLLSLGGTIWAVRPILLSRHDGTLVSDRRGGAA